jgi:anti-sigma factor RsiW
MIMNDHPHGEKISAYLDGMLNIAEMRQIAQHLDRCAACRISLDSLQRTRTLLHSMPPPQSPGPEFWANTFRRLRVEGNAPQTGRSTGKRLRLDMPGAQRRWAAGMAAAAVLGAVTLGPLLTHPAVSPPPPAISEDFVDMPSLVRAHTDSAAREPLADPDRQAMISADTDDVATFSDAAADTAGDGNAIATDAAH